MPNPIQPRLIRPEKDGQVGEWSYIFNTKGDEFIFPALVNELGSLKGLVVESKSEAAKDNREEPPSDEEPDQTWMTKVIYWKASDWETKYLPQAVAHVKRFGWKWPDIPYHSMEFRKIEDREEEERVTEVINIAALPADSLSVRGDCLLVHQFTGIDGESGDGGKPLLQWWSEGVINFERRRLKAFTWSIPQACERIADWGRLPGFLRDIVERDGLFKSFKMLSAHVESDGSLKENELRVATVWLAFCLYINSLKPEGEAIDAPVKHRGPKTLEEAVALEQAVVMKSAGILKSGKRRKTVANGEGTKHRYHYLVRGHERVINGKSIWIKPQIRGDGEFMVLPVATSPDIQLPKVAVTVNAARTGEKPATQTQQAPLLLPPPRLLLPAPRQVGPRPVGRGLLATLRRFLSYLRLA